MVKIFESDNADRERIASLYSPALGRCAGGRLILPGFVCPHCLSGNPQGECGAPAPKVPEATEPLRMKVTGILRWPYLASPKMVSPRGLIVPEPRMPFHVTRLGAPIVGVLKARYGLRLVVQDTVADSLTTAFEGAGIRRWGEKRTWTIPIKQSAAPIQGTEWRLAASSETQPICLGSNGMPERPGTFEAGQTVEVDFTVHTLETNTSYGLEFGDTKFRGVIASLNSVKFVGGFVRSID